MTSHDSETPAVGHQVITATAVIHTKMSGKTFVFVPRRAKTKKFLPNVFELPGGHVDFGESLIDGLKREIFEEFGMHVSVGDPVGAFTYLNDVKGSHSCEIVFFAQFLDDLDSISLREEDHSEFLWISKNDIQLIYSSEKTEEDEEFQILSRAFSILDGASPDFGNH
ncbi:NUDIX hydrolase [Marinobacter salarius]|jgi:8-oxo-dGTP pyrophosphatase MutT (NUDIX family)|uniref:NUDIX hydrolase n=1 Tax=Marinobacter salarius TaxID=1420917 RepID=UPI001BCB473E|nr:NUDIX hydrolase [Marinobacter salarius]MBS8230523.1 NUDIX hydrolase [Marinobacter salarius]